MNYMKTTLVLAFIALSVCLRGDSYGQVKTSHPQVNVAVDPRSSGEAEAELLTDKFHKMCPNISIVRDEAQAQYVLLASESDPWRGFLLHYYITVFDAHGKVVFATDKHHDKNATKAVCRFINGQK